MPYATSGGYLAPPKRRSPLTSSDPFGFRTARNTFGFDTRNGPSAAAVPARPARPVAAPTAVAPRAPVVTPTADTAFAQPQAPGGGSIYSLDTDPALQQAYAYTGRADQEAQAQAVADKTRLVEQAGLPDLAAALGLGGNVAQVASGNPFSTAANLKHSYQTAAEDLSRQNTDNRHNFDEQANQENLFYGGYHDTQLSKLADAFARAQAENTRGYQGGLSDLGGSVQNQLAQIGSALIAAQQQNDQLRMQAQQDARDRALQLALAGGGDTTGATAASSDAPVLGALAGGAAAGVDPLLLSLAGGASDEARRRAATGYLGPIGGARLAVGY
jgi:hypothetical protein